MTSPEKKQGRSPKRFERMRKKLKEISKYLREQLPVIATLLDPQSAEKIKEAVKVVPQVTPNTLVAVAEGTQKIDKIKKTISAIDRLQQLMEATDALETLTQEGILPAIYVFDLEFARRQGLIATSMEEILNEIFENNLISYLELKEDEREEEVERHLEQLLIVAFRLVYVGPGEEPPETLVSATSVPALLHALRSLQTVLALDATPIWRENLREFEIQANLQTRIRHIREQKKPVFRLGVPDVVHINSNDIQ